MRVMNKPLFVRGRRSLVMLKVDIAVKEMTELGMFYLMNISINPSDMFPKDMPYKICTHFTCKGKECNNAPCNFTHPKRPSELKRETILAITSCFTKRGIVRFNEYHFMKMSNITNKVKKLLRNIKGPNSKMA
jgi:hypothetical protein